MPLTPEQLFNDNQGLAYFCSKSFWASGYGYADEDLKQVALIALWAASQSFDASKGFQFSTYAGNVIRNSLCNIMRNGKRRPLLNGVCEEFLAHLSGYAADGISDGYINELKMSLSQDERDLLDYLILEYNLTELGKIYGITKQGIHRKVKALREKLRLLVSK